MKITGLKTFVVATGPTGGNFVFVKIGRPAAPFRDACQKAGVLVARDFKPYESTHCRVSIGTMDEMKKAVAVFKQILHA